MREEIVYKDATASKEVFEFRHLVINVASLCEWFERTHGQCTINAAFRYETQFICGRFYGPRRKWAEIRGPKDGPMDNEKVGQRDVSHVEIILVS